jgi:Fe-S oxidoreductase
MATRNEKDTTRARANILREFLTHSDKVNRFDHHEIYEVMDLCLSCKACKSECPSNVDMAKLKAEFLQQYYDSNGVPRRAKMIANFSSFSKLGSIAPWLYNFGVTVPGISNLVKGFSGFAQKRSMPTLYKTTLQKWYRKHKRSSASESKKRVYLFCDEFTNYNDTEIGIKAILLLEKLGYEVIIPEHLESGRTWLSKGLVRDAQKIINQNIELLLPLISEDTPLIGIEPSAILTFRDEYPDLAFEKNYESALYLKRHAYLIDEFIANEIDAGRISKGQFTSDHKTIVLHGHCQQKALSGVAASTKMLSLPVNYKVRTIPSGCCGMAGSFGFEKEHYDVSMQIGELVLFPTVRKQADTTIVAAPGTSCRHQIKDGTGVKALHTIEILYDALV